MRVPPGDPNYGKFWAGDQHGVRTLSDAGWAGAGLIGFGRQTTIVVNAMRVPT